jgi:hypothetical protein
MRHRHLRSQRWSYEAARSCLERGGLVEWRGLMRAVWVAPHGELGARLEHVLDDVEDAAHQHRQDPTSFEGGVDSVVYSLWRAYLRDARAWAVEHRR